MIQPAKRAQQVQEYYFSKKLRQIAEMRQNGADVINLGIGSPDLAPAPEVLDALNASARNPRNHGYQPYNGIPQLRGAFSEWYFRYFGVTLDAATEILPLIGSKEGIMHISMAFVDPGDEVLIPDPGYPAYESVTRLVGGKVRYYNLKEENGWYPDLAQLEAEGLGNVKLMWVNYPNMPTGTPASRELFAALIAFAKKHNILVCNDNPYSFILSRQRLSILETEGAIDIALELNSLSKSQNMAGWRVGMVAGNAAHISTILQVKSNMDSGMFQPVQAAAVCALNLPESWYDSVNATYGERRSYAEAIMQALGCTFDQAQTGLFLWAKIPETAAGAEILTDQILEKAHVFITPGSIFGNNGSRFLRISLCSTKELLSESLDRIQKMNQPAAKS